MATRTTSLRIGSALSERLKIAADHLGKNRNWVINRAIGKYLEAVYPDAFVREARRQSRLVAERDYGRQNLTAPKAKLGKVLGALSSREMGRVNEALALWARPHTYTRFTRALMPHRTL